MIELTSQKDFRRVRSLNFCYYCGNSFNDPAEKTKDHIPPSALFRIEDRNAPLILPAHSRCNGGQSITDEVLSQLIGLLHGKEIEEEKMRFKVHMIELANQSHPAVGLEVDLKRAIWRWVRAFHAALYEQFLPEDGKRAVHPPMPGINKVESKIVSEKILPQQLLLVEKIKKNRAAGRLDRIESRNGKCIYDCIWAQFNTGDWFCLFALQIYDWKQLGDSDSFPVRGCVGSYFPFAGLPSTATKAITIEVPISNRDKLDPFGV